MFVVGLGAAQGARGDEEQAGPLTVVCTTGMVADIVGQVGGEKVKVIGLMGSGVDPHLYKPTRSDMVSILRADVVFYSGLLLEGKMTDALKRAGRGGKPVHAVTELIDKSFLLEPPEFAGHPDPHVWMDPTAWIKAVEVVALKLGEADPANAARYELRADAVHMRLTDLDAYAKRVLATVPAESRVLVTAHDAFNYFGRRYGLEVVGILGISTDSEAGVRDIEQLVDLLVEREIRAVFIETTVSERNVRALIAGAAARGHSVVVGGSLFSDAMGEPGTYEGTYQGMIDHNVTTIVRALGGDAPEGGMVGKLGGRDGSEGEKRNGLKERVMERRGGSEGR